MRFTERVAVVTGAGSGIGRATAMALAREGAAVALIDLPGSPGLEGLQSELESQRCQVIKAPADVTDADAVAQAMDTTVQTFGSLDLLVTSAVYSDREPFLTANMQGFRRTIDVTMWGAFHCLRAAARQMIAQGKGGSIVLVSSLQAKVAHRACMAYNMAKAAVDQMGRTAALELAGHGIRVNLVYPGWTDTGGERKFFSEEVMCRASQELPGGRLAEPAEIARGILFLLDPASEYITGSTLAIDGGSSLPWWSRRGTGDF